MSNSILQPSGEKVCYISGSRNNLDIHHVYHGSANRKIADRNGFWCYLRHDIHMRLHDQDKDLDRFLEEECQKEFEKIHTRDEFRKLIGKSYL